MRAGAGASNGRSVRLFLVDGSPTGLVTAEIMNWTGHALIAPRSRLGEALRREEASRTGVYFLIGDDPEQPTRQRVYIGEGDNVSQRITSHNNDESKDYWTRFCLVTSKDLNLTKAHVRYLESRLIGIGKAAGRANLANGTEPTPRGLPEGDVADMEYFLEQVQVILPVVGLDFLRPKPKVASNLPLSTSAPEDPERLELMLESKRLGIAARAVDQDGELTVLAGSQANAGDQYAVNHYGQLRTQLLAEGKLVKKPEAEHLEFSEDVLFASPSAASSVIYNRNSNGRTEWRVKGTGQTLKDWQDAQVASANDEPSSCS